MRKIKGNHMIFIKFRKILRSSIDGKIQAIVVKKLLLSKMPINMMMDKIVRKLHS